MQSRHRMIGHVTAASEARRIRPSLPGRTGAMVLALALGIGLAGCQPDEGGMPADGDGGTTQSRSAEPAQPAEPSQRGESSGTAVDSTQAGEIATQKFGGTVKEVESDHYNGVEAWEVEIRDSDHGRIEVKVEKSTGRILHMETDD